MKSIYKIQRFFRERIGYLRERKRLAIQKLEEVMAMNLKRETMIELVGINAATLIQASIRGYLARRERFELTRQKSFLENASKIQKWWKKCQRSKFKILLDRTSPEGGGLSPNLSLYKGGDLERFSNANIIIEAVLDLNPKFNKLI
mgnify:CR=1 FL=1